MAITPYLLYQDVGAALKFLAKAFGLKKTGDLFRAPDGTISHAEMKLGRHGVMMGCPGKEYKNPRQLAQATQMLYIDITDVDKHCARAQKAGAKVIAPIEDTFYGDRRYGAEDPEGHQWYFAQPVKQRRPAKKKKKAKTRRRK